MKTLPGHLTAVWSEMSAITKPTISPAVLETLCIQIWRQRDARKRIDEEGEIVADSKGNPTPHPALVVERDAGKMIMTIMQKYGRPAK